jgi:hypothetical protein
MSHLAVGSSGSDSRPALPGTATGSARSANEPETEDLGKLVCGRHANVPLSGKEPGDDDNRIFVDGLVDDDEMIP